MENSQYNRHTSHDKYRDDLELLEILTPEKITPANFSVVAGYERRESLQCGNLDLRTVVTPSVMRRILRMHEGQETIKVQVRAPFTEPLYLLTSAIQHIPDNDDLIFVVKYQLGNGDVYTFALTATTPSNLPEGKDVLILRLYGLVRHVMPPTNLSDVPRNRWVIYYTPTRPSGFFCGLEDRTVIVQYPDRNQVRFGPFKMEEASEFYLIDKQEGNVFHCTNGNLSYTGVLIGHVEKENDLREEVSYKALFRKRNVRTAFNFVGECMDRHCPAGGFQQLMHSAVFPDTFTHEGPAVEWMLFVRKMTTSSAPMGAYHKPHSFQPLSVIEQASLGGPRRNTIIYSVDDTVTLPSPIPFKEGFLVHNPTGRVFHLKSETEDEPKIALLLGYIKKTPVVTKMLIITGVF